MTRYAIGSRAAVYRASVAEGPLVAGRGLLLASSPDDFSLSRLSLALLHRHRRPAMASSRATATATIVRRSRCARAHANSVQSVSALVGGSADGCRLPSRWRSSNALARSRLRLPPAGSGRDALPVAGLDVVHRSASRHRAGRRGARRRRRGAALSRAQRSRGRGRSGALRL